jgi:hypothetical protein
MLYVLLFALLAGLLSWCVSQLTSSANFPGWLVHTLSCATLVFSFWYFTR